MSDLKPDKILQRANGINVRIDSTQQVKISFDDREMLCTNHCLLILEAFAQPVSIRKALQKMNSASEYDWITLTGALRDLYDFGALRDPLAIEFTPSEKYWGFDAAPAHISMLNDKNRTQKFIEAIRETVKEGNVVVEIGTGSGVLAIAAARAGAARVYTIEAGAMARTARKIIDETEVAGKIQLLQGWSHQIELPEKADVLIGEIIGNDPFCENILQAFDDARRRMLKPDARIIPPRLKVFGLPVEVSDSLLKLRALTKENLENWKQWYNIDFSHLADNINYKDNKMLSLNAEKAKQLKVLGEAFLLADIDFHVFQDLIIEKTITSKLSQNGHLNGLLIYFELELGSRTITTNPNLTADDSSWINPIWYVSDTPQANAGDSFTFGFSYDGNRTRFDLREPAATK